MSEVSLNELDKRVSVLEIELTTMKESINTLDERTIQIKEKIDGWSVAIPYISDAIRNIDAKQSIMMDSINKNHQKDHSTSLKVNIMWSVIATMGASSFAIVGYLLKELLSK